MTKTFTHYSFKNGSIHFNIKKGNNPQELHCQLKLGNTADSTIHKTDW